MQPNKNKKITSWIAYSIATISIGIFVITIVLFLVNLFYYGFNEDKEFKYRYLGLFNENYRQKIVSGTSWISRSNSYTDFYEIGREEICVIELNRYNKVKIKDIRINNYLTKEHNTNFIKSQGTLVNNKYPYPNILLYPIYSQVKNIDIYIGSKIHKITKNNKFIYIKFEKTPLELRSIEKYPEFIFNCLSDPPIELLILNKNDTTLFIIKYCTEIKQKNERESRDHISLLDIVNLKWKETM